MDFLYIPEQQQKSVLIFATEAEIMNVEKALKENELLSYISENTIGLGRSLYQANVISFSKHSRLGYKVMLNNGYTLYFYTTKNFSVNLCRGMRINSLYFSNDLFLDGEVKMDFIQEIYNYQFMLDKTIRYINLG